MEYLAVTEILSDFGALNSKLSRNLANNEAFRRENLSYNNFPNLMLRLSIKTKAHKALALLYSSWCDTSGFKIGLFVAGPAGWQAYNPGVYICCTQGSIYIVRKC